MTWPKSWLTPGREGGWGCEGKPSVLITRSHSDSHLAQLVFISKPVCPALSSSLTNVREDLRCSEHEGFEELGVVLVLKECAIRTQRALDLEF